MRRAHVYVDVSALTYHDDGGCPATAGTDLRPVRRARLVDLQLDSCALCCASAIRWSWLRPASRRAHG